MDESLVLTMGRVPTAVISWQRAVTLIFDEKAIAVANYNYMLHSSRGEAIMFKPSVIQCIKSNFTPKNFTKTLPFNRRNVYYRDRGMCQYCRHKVSFNEFTFDHVIPQCEGGLSTWENVVVCCTDCNSRKGSGDPNFRGGQKKRRMLIRLPYAPRLSKAAPSHLVSKLAIDHSHDTWNEFIYWDVLLEP